MKPFIFIAFFVGKNPLNTINWFWKVNNEWEKVFSYYKNNRNHIKSSWKVPKRRKLNQLTRKILKITVNKICISHITLRCTFVFSRKENELCVLKLRFVMSINFIELCMLDGHCRFCMHIFFPSDKTKIVINETFLFCFVFHCYLFSCLYGSYFRSSFWSSSYFTRFCYLKCV